MNGRRRASVVTCVLVVLLLVTLMSMQTVQTLSLIRRGDNDRAKIMQAREVLELGRHVDWSQAESKTVQLDIPDGTLVAASATRPAVLEDQSSNSETSSAARFIARFPAGEPGEVTTVWEKSNE